MHTICLTTFLAAVLLAGSASAAGPKIQVKNPDLTKGDSIPDGADHVWTLGATGARGWMFSNKFTTTEARQIAITEVAKGSPADSVLKKGDVILGVAGKPFSHDPRTEFDHPALSIPSGTTGTAITGSYSLAEFAQLAVANPVLHPESAGPVSTDDTRSYWRDTSVSSSNFGHHWNHSRKIHFRIEVIEA